ncbi:hypothetical protein GCM10010972_21220 [Cellulomonas carbonis]|uniref:glycosyltransferase 87 family protein n=1 Tax=Cellulomonas carbonis TaxID=1386092 RepID=UPI0005BDBC71|nr:glycosyltransferase 87 family protein [Cellulomonas carbonis]GGC07706.1 hypothetical protein GCM10010972_21220 [Cellulomonas carbonis]
MLPTTPARLAAVWGSFVVVHAVLTVVGVVVVPAEAFWDLDLYRWWAWTVLDGAGAPLLDEPWVYPAGALVPVVAAGAVSTVSTPVYALTWCALVTVLDALVVAALLRRDAHRAAWWWLAALLALGPVAVGRLDAVAAALLALGVLAATSERPGRASVLLTAGAWVKVAPGALLLPLAAAARRPWRDVVVPAAVVTGLVVGAVGLAGGGPRVLSFLGAQGERGLQVESVAATPWVVAGAVDGRPAAVLHDELVTYEVPAGATAASALDVVLPVGVVAVGALLLVARRRGTAVEALVPAVLVLTTWLVVANKVGSPQFMTWVAAAVAVALASTRGGDWARRTWVVAALALAAAALTQVVFPWGYPALLAGDLAVTAALAGRNALLVALLVVAAAWLVRVVVGRDVAVRER